MRKETPNFIPLIISTWVIHLASSEFLIPSTLIILTVPLSQFEWKFLVLILYDIFERPAETKTLGKQHTRCWGHMVSKYIQTHAALPTSLATFPFQLRRMPGAIKRLVVIGAHSAKGIKSPVIVLIRRLSAPPVLTSPQTSSLLSNNWVFTRNTCPSRSRCAAVDLYTRTSSCLLPILHLFHRKYTSTTFRSKPYCRDVTTSAFPASLDYERQLLLPISDNQNMKHRGLEHLSSSNNHK